MNFTYDEYRKLLTIIKKEEYNFTDYNENGNKKKPIILRHDIDFSLEKAVEMAKLENALDIISTYFLLVSSDFYNIFSEKNSRDIKKIIDLGHNIGLHFDETKYKKDEIESSIRNEIKLLENVSRNEVNVISMHRPSKQTLEADYHFDGIINTYESRFFSEIKYISDSRMSWGTDPIEYFQNKHEDSVQLLVHPFWYNHTNLSRNECINNFVNSANKERYTNVATNIRDINEIMTPEQVR